MSNLIQQLEQKRLITPPSWLSQNVCYLTRHGSIAYGVSTNKSDLDVYGFCLPPKDNIFPWLAGEIPGFGKQTQKFEQYQQHHISDGNTVYDVQVYSIIKYFQLCMENNPNMIDSLFTKYNDVLYSNHVANMVRDKRTLFLHKGSFHKFMGYAKSQIHKAETKTHLHLDDLMEFEDRFKISHKIELSELEAVNAWLDHGMVGPKPAGDNVDILVNLDDMIIGDTERFIVKDGKPWESRPEADDVTFFDWYYSLYKRMIKGSKRSEKVKHAGADLKFLYHLARLADECEQILEHHDIDLHRSKDYLIAIRAGEVSPAEVKQRFSEQEDKLRKLFETSTLRAYPDEKAIKELLMNCLEHHYGNLSSCIIKEDETTEALRKIAAVLEEHRHLVNGTVSKPKFSLFNYFFGK